ncbi:MAG: MarR family transcriptional regulator [Candidatus Eisenbacteria bacterium]|nr:MarR family transcriptional regulator [Candidatus Eisenbacteria bacterium]
MAATKKVTADTWVRLTQSYHLAQKQCRDSLRGSGLTQPQFEVLAQIAGEEGIPLTRIGENLLVTGGNITGIVDRLEKGGLVKRKRDKEDRRIIRAFFTAKGKKLYQQATPSYDRFLKMSFGDLTPGDHVKLQKVLDQLRKKLDVE